ncbi:MAG: hypothetical protein K8L99_02145, partial [Anaerolineae bacterium]|nr:hypothetical protein [Anaerolineae bacterium]
CHHMSVIPGHPFDLGANWQLALAGGNPDWAQTVDGYIAAVDWPASHFWRELSAANPDALVILSTRDSAETWLESLNATVRPVAQLALADDWPHGRDLVTLFERFTGVQDWDDDSVLKAAYERQNDAVRQSISSHRLLEWRATEGWELICRALGLPVPQQPFPWKSRRSDWG